MKYLNFVGGDGLPAREDIAIMQREIPHWGEEMRARGVYHLGRSLDLPETAATVRVRDGETLVTDGPFTEAKEFIAGFDIIDVADLDEAIEVHVKHPVAWFMSFEIRPVAGELWLGERAPAFGRWEDGDTSPYALAAWTAAGEAVPTADKAMAREVETWRQGLAARGLLILGGTLHGPETATTLRVRAAQTLLSDGPFLPTGELITVIDAVSCTDRDQAIQLAATHPLARQCAVEVRPFERD
jgi:hypothetical protein